MKICPLIDWTSKDIWRYMNQHKLPDHPLFAQGYMSIGCAPCTRPVQSGEDERAGRWSGKTKTECGIHLDLSPKIAEGQ
jgi:phosphoadenosine phosphosulfate reductase